MGPEADGSSPQLGWAADGFPVMGPRGPGGVPMKKCGYDGADDAYCVDACGGYYGAWNGRDDFLYRYFMMGDDDVVLENPNRRWTADFFPHAPFCLLGCGSVVADGNDRDPSIGSKFPACASGAAPGTRDGYAPSPLAGVTESYATAPMVWPYGVAWDGATDDDAATAPPADDARPTAAPSAGAASPTPDAEGPTAAPSDAAAAPTSGPSSTGAGGFPNDSCRYALDGECDVPRYCDTGTDATDCAAAGQGAGAGAGLAAPATAAPDLFDDLFEEESAAAPRAAPRALLFGLGLGLAAAARV